MKECAILVAMYKKCNYHKVMAYIPIQVGMSLSKDRKLIVIKDDNGDNINLH